MTHPDAGSDPSSSATPSYAGPDAPGVPGGEPVPVPGGRRAAANRSGIPDAEERRAMVMESIGGWRGMVDSGLPVVIFVIANAIWGLTAGIWAAVGAGVLVLILRLARKQSVQQAIGGFFGVAIAVFIAKQTGEAKGFFLFGIWRSLILAGVVVLSVLIRWPIVGAVWEYLQPSGRQWRRDRRLMVLYSWTTLLVAALFGVRFVVERTLYSEDQTGWLAVARIALGYPLWLVVLGVVFFSVRRVRRREGLDGGAPTAKHRAEPSEA